MLKNNVFRRRSVISIELTKMFAIKKIKRNINLWNDKQDWRRHFDKSLPQVASGKLRRQFSVISAIHKPSLLKVTCNQSHATRHACACHARKQTVQTRARLLQVPLIPFYLRGERQSLFCFHPGDIGRLTITRHLSRNTLFFPPISFPTKKSSQITRSRP